MRLGKRPAPFMPKIQPPGTSILPVRAGMIEIARTVNPRIETLVRTHSEEEAVLLEKENAGKVFLGEHELAHSMIQFVLDRYAARREHG